jgi:hypothetical protein
MVDLHIPTLKKWDQTKNVHHPFVFAMVIGTNVGVVLPWA